MPVETTAGPRIGVAAFVSATIAAVALGFGVTYYLLYLPMKDDRDKLKRSLDEAHSLAVAESAPVPAGSQTMEPTWVYPERPAQALGGQLLVKVSSGPWPTVSLDTGGGDWLSYIGMRPGARETFSCRGTRYALDVLQQNGDGCKLSITIIPQVPATR